MAILTRFIRRSPFSSEIQCVHFSKDQFTPTDFIVEVDELKCT
jgi:hypothetical protein